MIKKTLYGHYKEPVYDDEDRVVGEIYGEIDDQGTSTGTEKFKYQYNAEGNLGYHEDLVNGINYRYIYDLSGRLGKVVGSNGNSIKYDYDFENNISNVTEKIKGITEDKAYSTDYTYDKDNKQKTITYDGNNIGFDYDSLGRLDIKIINTGTITFATNYAYEDGAEANSTTTRVSTITNNGSTITYTEDKPYVNLIYTCQKSQAPMSFGHI
ncbi:hypothetical protein SH2C18_30060 [Clostridium sediminicola]|uniref:hypothetical protein n=1 Tax=Clostridium sediminicola TaxID=3114879 RepID=UPI0031F2621B